MLTDTDDSSLGVEGFNEYSEIIKSGNPSAAEGPVVVVVDTPFSVTGGLVIIMAIVVPMAVIMAAIPVNIPGRVVQKDLELLLIITKPPV